MLNFGVIKETMTDILVEGILSKNGDKKHLYQKFTTKIKNNKVLKEQFIVYRNIETKIEKDSSKIDNYISENISLLKRFGIDKIKKENKKLLQELNIEIKSDFDYNKKQLHEEICKLLQLKKEAKNLNSIVESVSKISDFIKENKPKKEVNENLVPTSILAKISTEKFNKRYSDISETEKSIIKVMVEGKNDQKEVLLKNKINECIGLIDESFDNSDIEVKNKLLKVKNKLMNITFNEKNFINDISTVMNLSENLNSK